MLYREIIAVCSQIYTKHINTPCGQKVELLNVKLVVRNSNHWHVEVYALKGILISTTRYGLYFKNSCLIFFMTF